MSQFIPTDSAAMDAWEAWWRDKKYGSGQHLLGVKSGPRWEKQIHTDFRRFGGMARKDRVFRGMHATINIELSNQDAFVKTMQLAPKMFKKSFAKVRRRVIRNVFLPAVRLEIPKSRGVRKKHLRGTVGLRRPKVDETVVKVGSSKLWYAAIVHNVTRGPSVRYGKLPRPFYDRAWDKVGSKVISELDEVMGKFTFWLKKWIEKDTELSGPTRLVL